VSGQYADISEMQIFEIMKHTLAFKSF